MFLSKSFRILSGFATLFLLSITVFSCTKKDDPSNFIPTGTYDIKKISDGSELEDASGKISIKDAGNDNFKVAVKNLSYKGIQKDLTFDLSATLKKIDEGAYELDFKKYDFNDKNYPFDFKYALGGIEKALLGIEVDVINFENKNITAEFTLGIEPPAEKKITYNDKKYNGVIQKNQFDMAMKITAKLKVSLTQDQLINSVKQKEVREKVTAILASSDPLDKLKRDGLQAIITKQLADFKNGNAISKNLTLVLKK